MYNDVRSRFTKTSDGSGIVVIRTICDTRSNIDDTVDYFEKQSSEIHQCGWNKGEASIDETGLAGYELVPFFVEAVDSRSH